MYEVICMTYDYDWEIESETQMFESVQFKTWNEAINYFNEKKQDINNEHVKIVRILEEYSR